MPDHASDIQLALNDRAVAFSYFGGTGKHGSGVRIVGAGADVDIPFVESYLDSIAWIPGTENLLVASSTDSANHLTLVNARSGAVTWRRDVVPAVSFSGEIDVSPDGTRIIGIGSLGTATNELRLYWGRIDVGTTVVVQPVRGRGETAVGSPVFLNDSEVAYLAQVGNDDIRRRAIAILKLPSGEPITTITLARQLVPNSLSTSAGGRLLGIAYDSVTGDRSIFRVSADGRTMVAATDAAKPFDVSSDETFVVARAARGPARFRVCVLDRTLSFAGCT
jgi:WD40 repeat protein